MTEWIEREAQDFPQLQFLDKFLEGTHGFIAGGAFKNIFGNEKFKDIDIWFKNENHYQEAKDHYDVHYDEMYDSGRAVGYDVDGTRVELISVRYGTPQEILESFDFTVTKFGYGNRSSYVDTGSVSGSIIDEFFKEGEKPPTFAIFHPMFFEHLQLKRLIIEGDLPKPINTFERTYRYTKYGYELCLGSKAKLIRALRDMEDFDESELGNLLYAGLD